MPDTQTMLKRVRDKQRGLQGHMVDLLDDAWDADAKEQKPFTGEQQSKHEQIVAGWKQSMDEERIFSHQAEEERIDAEKEDLLSAPGFAAKRAKANADTYRNLIKVGQNEYRGEAPPGGTPNQLELPVPAVSRGSDGKNHVHPFPAVFGGGSDDDGADIEAAFRNYEIIRAGKVGQYDPATGKKVEADIDTTDFKTDAIPDIAMDMYMYMITMNVLAEYMTIHQTSGINSIVVTQRRTVPNAAVYGTRANSGQGVGSDIPELDPTYETTKLDSLAYAAIIKYAYVTTTVQTPWSFASTVARDGGIALANGFGAHCATGDGRDSQARGCQHYVASETAARIDNGVANGTAFIGSGANRTFTLRELFRWFGSMPIPYYNNTEKRIVCNLATWLDLLSIRDDDGQPLLLNSMGSSMPNSILGIPAVLDQNMPTIAANAVPMLIGDLGGHAIHYAGGPRVDFSSEHGFGRDQLSYRFIQHADAQVIDINAYRGYKFT